MKKPISYLDFKIDKLTRSIENVITGDSFQTDILRLRKIDLTQVQKSIGWNFTWKIEWGNPTKEVYKLVISSSPEIIQGLISLSIKEDNIYVHLIESAPFNLGKKKIYLGVPGNLMAYACKISFQNGFDGFVSFHSKTRLIEHYEMTLGAYHVGGHLMIIQKSAALNLINKYFKN